MKSLKYLSLILTFSIIVLGCSDDKSEQTNTSENNAETETIENSPEVNDGMSDTTSSEAAEIESDVPGIPAINSSYYGQDPSGAEVTYNFFGGGKFEKFSFKGDNEKNISGTYKKNGETIELNSPDGIVSFKSVGGDVYDVMQNGKKLYSVKLIK